MDTRLAFRKLPRALLQDVLALDAAMREIEGELPRKRSARARHIAARFQGRRGWSSARLLARFYAWQKSGGKEGGAIALVDHARCCGCGLPGCTQPQQSALSPDIVREWMALAITNKKAALCEAWRVLIRKLADGDAIAGTNWKLLYMHAHPGHSLPPMCPWSEGNPPPGWSLSNFLARRGSDLVYRAAKEGMSKVATLLPQVRMDFSELRPLEAVVFDDHRLDFHVYVTDRMGRTQIVELWGLFAMDVATRSVIHFGLRPKLLREDGTTEGLTRRDMQHLISAILAEYGHPMGYQMNLIVENAAAAVSADTERLIAHHSRGQVVVRRTGVRCNDVVLSGFPERWGNPRGKSWLESWFHPLDIALGAVKGQTGSNWTKTPAEYEARLASARKVQALLDLFNEEEREAFRAPLLWAGQAQRLVAHAISVLNERTDHECVGFDAIPTFRWSLQDTCAKPALLLPGMSAEAKREVEAFLSLPPEAKQVLIDNYGGWTRESPAAKMRRLYRPQDFQRLDPLTHADLLLDSQRLRYGGGGTIEIRIRRGRNEETVQFAGDITGLALGQEVEVRFDSDRPGAGAWLVTLNSNGDPLQVAAHLEHQAKPGAFRADDAALLRRRLGQVARAQAEIQSAARGVMRTAIRERVEDAESNLQIAAALALPRPAKQAPPREGSEVLIAAITTGEERLTPAAQALADLEALN